MCKDCSSDRRIVRVPTCPHSHNIVVRLVDDTPAVIQLRYIGGEIDGREALTPTYDSLANVLRTMLPQSAESILQDIKQSADKWPQRESRPHQVQRPPVCPRVVVGQMLQLRLPVVYGTLTHINIGIVCEITAMAG